MSIPPFRRDEVTQMRFALLWDVVYPPEETAAVV